MDAHCRPIAASTPDLHSFMLGAGLTGSAQFAPWGGPRSATSASRVRAGTMGNCRPLLRWHAAPCSIWHILFSTVSRNRPSIDSLFSFLLLLSLIFISPRNFIFTLTFTPPFTHANHHATICPPLKRVRTRLSTRSTFEPSWTLALPCSHKPAASPATARLASSVQHRATSTFELEVSIGHWESHINSNARSDVREAAPSGSKRLDQHQFWQYLLSPCPQQQEEHHNFHTFPEAAHRPSSVAPTRHPHHHLSPRLRAPRATPPT